MSIDTPEIIALWKWTFLISAVGLPIFFGLLAIFACLANGQMLKRMGLKA